MDGSEWGMPLREPLVAVLMGSHVANRRVGTVGKGRMVELCCLSMKEVPHKHLQGEGKG